VSILQYGLTPKMKPLSPKRTALIAALDVGTSKVACLIARLKPNTARDTLRRRSHSVEVLGFGHTSARGMKAGAVIDLTAAEAAIRQAVDLAERAAKLQLEAVVVSVSAGRPESELISASVDVAGSAVSGACFPPAAATRPAPAAPCCTRCRSATRSMTPSAFATRAA
jgi:cell division protein FtsA